MLKHSPLLRLFSAALAVGVCSSPALAEDEGQDDLDRAIETKLSAESYRELGLVADLCQSALSKGLSKDNQAFAKQLLASTLLKRAEVVSSPLVEGAQLDVQAAQRWQLAVAELERAVQANPDLAPAQLLMGKLQSLPFGDADRAKQALDAAVRLIKDDDASLAEALRLRAGVEKDSDKKLADLNEAIKLAPDDARPLRDRGNLHISQNKAEDALRDFDAALKLDPDDPTTHEAKGLALSTLEKWDEARDSLTKAAELNPESPVPLIQRGRINFLAGDNQAAIDDATQALKVSQDNVYALLLRAQVYGQTKQWEEGLADADRAVTLAPGSSQAIRIWAMLVAAAGKVDEVLPELERQHTQTPEDTATLLRLAMIYGAKKQFEKAIEAYTETLQQEPTNWFAHQGRADTYLSIGKQAEALADYDQAIKLDPENSGVLNNLAWLLATSPEEKLRDGKRAIELATKACEVTEYKQAHILSTLAAAYAETGDFDEAKKWSSKAVEMGDETMKEQLSKELESYKAGKPWRELQNEAANSDPDKAGKDKEAQ
jgi:tetratricopeptide (TPR) repeat protein